MPFGFGVGDAPAAFGTAGGTRPGSSVPFGFGVGDALEKKDANSNQRAGRLQCLSALASGTPTVREFRGSCFEPRRLQCLSALASGTPQPPQRGPPPVRRSLQCLSALASGTPAGRKLIAASAAVRVFSAFRLWRRGRQNNSSTSLLSWTGSSVPFGFGVGDAPLRFEVADTGTSRVFSAFRLWRRGRHDRPHSPRTEGAGLQCLSALASGTPRPQF